MSAPVNQTPAYQPQQQYGLSPEAKSAFTTAGMSALLGATWFAKPKIGGADDLFNATPDKFERATKKIAKLSDDKEAKQAYTILKTLREQLKDTHITQTNALFGANTELPAKDLFKNIDPKSETGLMLQRIANTADKNGIVTRANAEKVLKRYNVDCCMEQIHACFEAMKYKLPKTRIKSGAKWGAIGLGVAILSNIVFGIIGAITSKKA